jgi:hypothetical protein
MLLSQRLRHPFVWSALFFQCSVFYAYWSTYIIVYWTGHFYLHFVPLFLFAFATSFPHFKTNEDHNVIGRES